MRLIPMMLCSAMTLAGCQTVPDLSDTTTASLRLRIHYDTPGLTTPKIEVGTPTNPQVSTPISIDAKRCVYVNDPFGVVANVSDSGGVRSIVIGPSGPPFDAVIARTDPEDILAIPAPAEKDQMGQGGAIPNPGTPPDSAAVSVVYSTVKAFTDVTLLSVYQFRDGATHAQLRATARNWGPSTGVAEVYGFHVEKADPSDPQRQPGMACSTP